jgi:hypothetical protein
MLLLKTLGLAKVVLIPGRLGILSIVVSSIYFGVLHLVLLAMTQGFWSFNVRLNHVTELSRSPSPFVSMVY